MRFYHGRHPFYRGLDLHARTMQVRILDQAGQTVFDKGIPCRPEAPLRAIQPYREHLVIGAESMFARYWVADLCAEWYPVHSRNQPLHRGGTLFPNEGLMLGPAPAQADAELVRVQAPRRAHLDQA